jgi:hypothetical protein
MWSGRCLLILALNKTEGEEIYLCRREKDKRNKHEYMSAVGPPIPGKFRFVVRRGKINMQRPDPVSLIAYDGRCNNVRT